jgi:drug/metabolite transporter (DMT)-like permease
MIKKGVRKMKHSKSSLFILSIVGVFLVVYGTAVILRLLFGDFLLDGGLSNLNYLLLALLCAVPFLIYLVVGKNYFEKVTEVVLTSGLFFLILFVYANILLVFSMTEQSQAITVRLLTTFPVVALILVVVLHFFHRGSLRGKDLVER